MSSFRIEKLSSHIRAIVGDVILNKLNDPRLSPMTSVTRVELSGDLQVAKVFISVMGSDTERRTTMSALHHARGHIQRYLAKNLQTRHCPELRLELDESLKKAAETVELIDRTMRDHEAIHEDGAAE